MKAKTNLPSTKGSAQTFLMINIKTTPHSLIIVTHLFIDRGFVYFEGDGKPKNICTVETILKS